MALEKDFDSAFIATAKTGDVEVLRALLQAHDAPSREALRIALFEQSWRDSSSAMVQALIAAGADLEARDDYDHMTPLMVAANSGAGRNAKLLIAAGANVNAEPARGLVYQGANALSLACFRGYSEIVQLLIWAGADVNARSGGGSTPLMTAASRNFPHIAKMRLAAGADPALKRDDGFTALGLARGNSTAADILKALASEEAAS